MDPVTLDNLVREEIRDVCADLKMGASFNRAEYAALVQLTIDVGAKFGFSKDTPLRPVDPIGKPGHYATGTGGFVQDHCDAFELRCSTSPDRGLSTSTERFLGGMEHNATKYLWRAGEKPQAGNTGPEAALRDWRAARWYVDRGVKHLERLISSPSEKKE